MTEYLETEIFFQHEEEDYYQPIRVCNFWSNYYIECKGKGDRKILSVKNILIKLDHTSKIA